MQIAFVPLNRFVGGPLIFKKINGVKYGVSSSSFLCWGIDQATLIYQTQLIAVRSFLFLFLIKFFLFISISQENEYQADNLVSCYPANSMISVNGHQILDSPCTNGQTIKIRNFNLTVNTSRINQVKQEKN